MTLKLRDASGRGSGGVQETRAAPLAIARTILDGFNSKLRAGVIGRGARSIKGNRQPACITRTWPHPPEINP